MVRSFEKASASIHTHSCFFCHFPWGFAAYTNGKAPQFSKENGGYYYQYTFIDEYSRFRYLEAFKEHNSYSSAEFIKHCVKRFPYAIECVQTDNGPEFTNRLNSQCSDKKTLFEVTLCDRQH